MRRALLVTAALLVPAVTDVPAAGGDSTRWVLAMPPLSPQSGRVGLTIRLAPDSGYRRRSGRLNGRVAPSMLAC